MSEGRWLLAGNRWLAAVLLLLGGSVAASAQQQVDPVVLYSAENGLSYVADDEGNRVPDFSHAGYRGGGVALPDVPAVVSVPPADGDDGARLQAALDYVADLPLSDEGWRGAVQLEAAHYQVEGFLSIGASGVVLRGAGSGEDGTVIEATGNGRRTLIQVFGEDDRRLLDEASAVVDEYVPVGSRQLTVDNVEQFSVGDRVVAHRPSTEAWITAVAMGIAPARTPYRWREGDIDLHWDRRIVAIEGDRLELDAPLTTALEARFGGGTVQRYEWPGRISEVGVEHLRLVSAYNEENPHDEEHSWMAVQLDDVENAWVSDVIGLHFVSSVVDLGRGSRAITVQDSRSIAPVSEIAGYRRHSFHTSGQLALFQRCYAEDGIHDFTVGNMTTGPNVFLKSMALLPHSFSGSIGSWASGVLFDNVDIDGNALKFDNLEIWNQGVGWSAANSMIWQSTASVIVLKEPPTATNWAVAVWSQFIGDGKWMQTSTYTKPESLYRAQLAERLGAGALEALEPQVVDHSASAPPIEQAVPDLEERMAPEPRPAGRPLSIGNGWIIGGDKLLAGGQRPITWWRGSVLPKRSKIFHSNITRFVPGRAGKGLTDDLDELTDSMLEENQVSLRHHYGLWYDRRRDDHERTRRIDADVWPPFLEQPWARTGKGESWHRLSEYDLTQFNPWYFRRLREFAEHSRDKGLVLINEMYFQHNILESGTHWVDSPWRPTNAVQPTGFTEPPPWEGDTVVMADEFYDVNHPVRRPLHRAYIRKSLENFADHPNVLHTVSAEFTGPLHFVEFWLDVIAEWQEETGQDAKIALSTTKDVQDAILEDPERSGLIDVIDFTYWYRTDTGSEFAPKGGMNLAPRQHARRGGAGGRATGSSIAGMVAEYRERYPDKAIITSLRQAEGWPFVAAGGSLPELPADVDPQLLSAIPRMQPIPGGPDGQWILAEKGEQYFAYRDSGAPIELDLRNEAGAFELWRIDLETGAVRRDHLIRGGNTVSLEAPAAARPHAAWLRRSAD